MVNLKFDYNSERAAKARFAIKMDKTRRLLLKIGVVALLASGVGLVVLGMPVGWLVMSMFAPMYIVLYWWKKDLSKLDAELTTGLNGLLTSGVAGLLPPDPTPVDIALAVSQVSSGRFLALRFGIGPKFLPEIAANLMIGSDVVWQNALNIRAELSGRMISGGVLSLAIIRSLPNYENLLARLQLDYSDLVSGVKWHDRISDMIEMSKQPVRNGGIARDWAFGYTPTLSRFGRNISQEISVHGGRTMSLAVESHKEITTRMINILSSNGRQNVAIVGPSGAGKTSVVHDFAEKLLDASSDIPDSLKFRQVFLLDSAALISEAPGRGELEKLINALLVEAYVAKNIVICLDDAQLFFEDDVGSVDISNILLPILRAGNLRMILTFSEQKLLQIAGKKPEIINAINRINIGSSNYQETLAAMEDKVMQMEYYSGKIYMFQALKRAYELSERYIYDLVQPGRAIKMLELAANYPEGNLVTSGSIEKAIEQTLGVKVGIANVDAEKLKLLRLEELIHERMVNQTRAVKVVSDALRRARTGVRNQSRPIGTFLFLGPTGVGKTELAKALAEVYYGGENNLVRIDLNQYVTNEDVANLTADGSDNPNSLTASMMKNPFSVVLLDEIEKAHPNVLAALLQVLDEGILRDVKNREVSFRDAIVIATSNAGSERISDFVGRGYDLGQFQGKIINELIDTRQFRPEFLNRFDEIVMFKPLGQAELAQVVDLMIKGVNKTLVTQKVTVEMGRGAKELLIQAGYDPKFGARPMRRVIQRVVENHVAKKILSGEVESGGVVHITDEVVREALRDSEE